MSAPNPCPWRFLPDKNTLTIKPNTSGYMPSYLMLVDEGSYGAPLAKTCGDIVMTRK